MHSTEVAEGRPEVEVEVEMDVLDVEVVDDEDEVVDDEDEVVDDDGGQVDGPPEDRKSKIGPECPFVSVKVPESVLPSALIVSVSVDW